MDIGTADAGRIVVNANDIDLATHGTAGTYNGLPLTPTAALVASFRARPLSDYGITDAQPLDATLTALAGITTAADELIYATGSDSCNHRPDRLCPLDAGRR